VPAARPDEEHGRLGIELVRLAGLRIGEVDRAGPAVFEIELTLDDVRPGRRVSVLEVRHEHLGTGVERVDDHLAVNRAGDLDATVEEVGGDRRDAPLAFANRSRLRQEIGQAASVEMFLALLASLEESEAGRVELAMQVGEEGERLLVQDFPIARPGGTAELDTSNRTLGFDDGHRNPCCCLS